MRLTLIIFFKVTCALTKLTRYMYVSPHTFWKVHLDIQHVASKTQVISYIYLNKRFPDPPCSLLSSMKHQVGILQVERNPQGFK